MGEMYVPLGYCERSSIFVDCENRGEENTKSITTKKGKLSPPLFHGKAQNVFRITLQLSLLYEDALGSLQSQNRSNRMLPTFRGYGVCAIREARMGYALSGCVWLPDGLHRCAHRQAYE